MLNGNFSSSLANLSQLKIGLEGAYQQENAALALQTASPMGMIQSLSYSLFIKQLPFLPS